MRVPLPGETMTSDVVQVAQGNHRPFKEVALGHVTESGSVPAWPTKLTMTDPRVVYHNVDQHVQI